MIRVIALFVCYSFAPLMLGFALAVGTFHAMYPGIGDPLRALAFAGALLILILLGWFLMPQNRPWPGAPVVQVLMMWSLIFGAMIARLGLHQQALSSREWVALSVCVLTLVAGAWLTRWTKWGKKWFVVGK